MSDAAACNWPLRVSPRAARDFDELIKNHRDKVVACLTSPIDPGKWRKLESTHNLWRMHVDHAVRLVVNIQRGVAYVWRILDRKDVYRTVRNQNPGHALTGITLEEFLMKAAATPKRSGKDNGTKPAANGNGHGGGPTSPPAAGATPAGDGEIIRPSSHPLLSALSQYLGEYMRTDVDAILAIVEDRTDGFEGEILSLGESLAKLEAREGELAAGLARELEHTAELAKSHEGLSQGVEQLGSRVGTLGGALSDATERLGGEITALAREIDRRMGDLQTASEEDRKNASLGFAELGRQLEFLSNEGSTLRSTADAHETSLRRLESELAGSSARLESLSESVVGLSGELERIRTEQSNRNTLHHLATLAARIRAVFSPRGAA